MDQEYVIVRRVNIGSADWRFGAVLCFSEEKECGTVAGLMGRETSSVHC